MKKLLLNGRTVEVYDSIDELPIVNFQKYNKYLLIDSGIGSDIDSIDAHIMRIAKLMARGSKEDAMRELQNMRQNLYMVNSEISPRYMAFAALVRSIDGKEVGSVTDDSMKEVLESINQAPHSKVLAWLLELKKKIQEEVELYFPENFDSVREKEAYDNVKRRTLLVLQGIIHDKDNSKEIEALDEKRFDKYRPGVFTGPDSAEIVQDKQFEDICLLVSQKLNREAKRMTVLEFYNAINFIRRQAEAESKSLKQNRRHR